MTTSLMIFGVAVVVLVIQCAVITVFLIEDWLQR